jgi:tetratricopeptide (TPR) repeat protein
LLRNAVKEPVREIIAVEVDTESRAREITGELVALDSSRPNRIIEVDPIKSEPSELLVAARETVGMWPSEPGLLLFLDVSRPHPGEDDARAAAFWQAMNMLREQWDALNCQAIFFLLPYNYRLLSSSADHLKRWMALKVHLLGRKIDTEELDSAPLTMGLVDPSFAKQTLQALEAQLTEAIKRGEPPETLVRRYYLPMFAQAVSLGDIGRAEHLQKSLEAVQIPENELSGWFNVTVNYELGRFRLDRAEEVAKQHLNWARDRKNLNQEAIALFNLGQVARARGDLDAAEQSCLKSLEIERDLGDTYGEARRNVGFLRHSQSMKSLATRRAPQDPIISWRYLRRYGETLLSPNDSTSNLSLLARSTGISKMLLLHTINLACFSKRREIYPRPKNRISNPLR